MLERKHTLALELKPLQPQMGEKREKNNNPARLHDFSIQLFVVEGERKDLNS